MPIRFRCVYCEKLLGIARRKAGSVVNCPHCNEKLIVPTPDPDHEEEASHREELDKGTDEDEALPKLAPSPSPTKAPAPRKVPAKEPAAKLFEQSDVSALLAGESTYRGNDDAPLPMFGSDRPTVKTSEQDGDPLLPAGLMRTSPPIMLKSDLLDEPKAVAGYHLSPAKATWLSLLVVVLLALAFAGGLMVGKFIK